MSGIRPIIRLAQLYWFRWAQHDLQRKNPHHPDLPYVILRRAALEREGK